MTNIARVNIGSEESVRGRGTLTINPQAMELLGNPSSIDLVIDRGKQRITILPSGQYALPRPMSNGYVVVGAPDLRILPPGFYSPVGLNVYEWSAPPRKRFKRSFNK